MTVKINLMPEKSAKRLGPNGRGSFLFTIASIFFAISLLAFASISIWQKYFLEKSLSENKAKNSALNAEISKKLESPSLAANAKAKGAEKILASHLYLSNFYQLLESLTLKKVFYEDFLLDAADAKSGGIRVKISGEADDFKTLAKQLAVYRESADIADVSFENAQMGKSGKIEFGVELIFKRSSVNPVRSLNQR